MIPWMLVDSDKGRDDPLPQVRGITPLARRKEQERSVRSLQDNRTRKRFKVSVGIAVKLVINRRIVRQGHNRTKDNQILLGKETTRKASLAKVERKANPKMRELLCGISRLLHRRVKQAQQLAR